ncbi:MAG: hypothetical protein PHX10_13530 [Gallionellaceae bacterium]|nr:hypothetical protein [Gallionellaceae bacterium]
MQRLELDFLRTRPAIPAAAWLLLAAGIVMALLAGNRYLRVSDELALEKARAARLAPMAKAHKAAAQPARPEAVEGDLLAVPWSDLLGHLETTRPANIAFLSLAADGRKGVLTLTAEARNAAAMIDYLEALRQQGGFRSVTLTGHTLVQADNGIESLHFVARLRWGP